MRNNKNNIICNIRNITLSLIILMSSFTNIILCFSNNFVSALSYESEVGIGFTFNPTLSVSLSSSDLIISNLTPDSSGNSNSINVSVATNAAYGYTLFATVGDNTHNNSNLTHSNNTNIFSSISTDADLSNLTTDNTWGYTAKLPNETNWNNYNGLSSSANTTLIDNSNTADSTGSIDFKIGAKASNTQASGIYTNTINFIAVSKVAPMSLLDSFIASGAEQYNGYFKMQDMTHDICQNVDIEESELQLIDIRDNKIYWVAKLKDGNCWMTQNLDLDLSHEVALTSETSDIDPATYGTGIYTSETGYIRDEITGVVSWLPSAIDENGIQRADTIDMVWDGNSATVPGWSDNYNNPYSANPGDRHMYTNSSTYNESMYTSLQACTSDNNNDVSGCQHTHFGNYYNWSAAAATNDASSAPSRSTWGNSACPKNWGLPPNGKYTNLMTAQKIYNSGSSYATNGFNKLRTSPLFFQRFGLINGGSLNYLASFGNYWSSTTHNNAGACYLDFSGGNIWPSNDNYMFYGRNYGFSVRCLAK